VRRRRVDFGKDFVAVGGFVHVKSEPGEITDARDANAVVTVRDEQMRISSRLIAVAPPAAWNPPSVPSAVRAALGCCHPVVPFQDVDCAGQVVRTILYWPVNVQYVL
jgi:hypothetical protein